jgi:hypothetical protein
MLSKVSLKRLIPFGRRHQIDRAEHRTGFIEVNYIVNIHVTEENRKLSPGSR